MTKINKEEAKEKLLQFLKSMTREMLFTDIEAFFDSIGWNYYPCGEPMEYLIHPEYKKVVLWSFNVETIEIFLEISCKLEKYGIAIVHYPELYFAYCAGGKISAFPKTNWQGMKKCKTPHWLPVAFTKKEWNG